MIFVAAVACVIIQIPFGVRVVLFCGVGAKWEGEGGWLCAIAAPRNRRQRDCIRINEGGTRRRTDLLMCTSNCWSFRLIIYVYVTFHVNTQSLAPQSLWATAFPITQHSCKCVCSLHHLSAFVVYLNWNLLRLIKRGINWLKIIGKAFLFSRLFNMINIFILRQYSCHTWFSLFWHKNTVDSWLAFYIVVPFKNSNRVHTQYTFQHFCNTEQLYSKITINIKAFADWAQRKYWAQRGIFFFLQIRLKMSVSSLNLEEKLFLKKRVSPILNYWIDLFLFLMPLTTNISCKWNYFRNTHLTYRLIYLMLNLFFTFWFWATMRVGEHLMYYSFYHTCVSPKHHE